MSETIDLRIAANGRMVLPKVVRDAMGLSGDAKVTLTIEGDSVRLEPLSYRVLRARELYHRSRKSTRTTEDFLRDRREETMREEGEVVTIDDPAADVATP